MIFHLALLSCITIESPPILALEDFKIMHPKVYEVYREDLHPEELHDALSEVFIGDRLTKEYIEHFTTQHHMLVEETEIDIKQIDYNSLDIVDYDLEWIKIDADWSVGGIVSHQKHKHTRINRYRAVYTLVLNPQDQWRVNDVKMRNAERIRRASDEEILEGTDQGGGYLDPLDLLEAGMMNPDPDDENEKANFK